MWIETFFKSLRSTSAHQRPTRRRPPASRLCFEPLEDRKLLAFLGPVDYAIGANPQAVATADFNNDGRLDLATADSGDNSVSVLLGDGQGGFAPAINSAAGANPVSLAVGDFNGDGTMDLAAANGGTSAVSIALGNGDGSFRAPSNIDIGSGVESVAVGDFNSDGTMDLVVTSNHFYPQDDVYPYSGEANVLQGTGDGSFLAPRAVRWFMDRGIGSVVVGDFNGDGNQDFATNFSDCYSVTVSLGDGQGNFPDGSWAILGGLSMAAGDVNGDGRDDLVAASGYDVQVLLGPLESQSFGGWVGRDPQHYDAGSDPTAVVLGDFDRDEVLDIAAANPGSSDVGILRGLGDGAFSAPEYSAAGPGAIAVAAGDWSGDGWLDLATADPARNTASVQINDQSWQVPQPPPPPVTISDATIAEGNTGTAYATFTLTLSKASAVDVTVHYATADGTASAGSDYAAASGTVTIPAGQTTTTVAVAVFGDRLVEPNETFAVTLSGATNAAIADAQGLGTILDDEPRISISDVTKKEGNGKGKTTQFTFVITVSAAYDQPVTMSYRTVNDTATTADGDYLAKTGTLTFAPGETTKTITIEVKGDNRREANETFYLDLFDLSSNASFTKNRGLGTILNDD